jgi:hypothetical protein
VQSLTSAPLSPSPTPSASPPPAALARPDRADA